MLDWEWALPLSLLLSFVLSSAFYVIPAIWSAVCQPLLVLFLYLFLADTRPLRISLRAAGSPLSCVGWSVILSSSHATTQPRDMASPPATWAVSHTCQRHTVLSLDPSRAFDCIASQVAAPVAISTLV